MGTFASLTIVTESNKSLDEFTDWGNILYENLIFGNLPEYLPLQEDTYCGKLLESGILSSDELECLLLDGESSDIFEFKSAFDKYLSSYEGHEFDFFFVYDKATGERLNVSNLSLVPGSEWSALWQLENGPEKSVYPFSNDGHYLVVPSAVELVSTTPSLCYTVDGKTYNLEVAVKRQNLLIGLQKELNEIKNILDKNLQFGNRVVRDWS